MMFLRTLNQRISGQWGTMLSLSHGLMASARSDTLWHLTLSSLLILLMENQWFLLQYFPTWVLLFGLSAENHVENSGPPGGY